MNWIQLPNRFINLDHMLQVQFDRPPRRCAVITWNTHPEYRPESILEGKEALCLYEALEQLAAEFIEPIRHHLTPLSDEPVEDE